MDFYFEEKNIFWEVRFEEKNIWEVWEVFETALGKYLHSTAEKLNIEFFLQPLHYNFQKKVTKQ